MNKIFELTGNPFIDMGALVLKERIDKDNLHDITKEEIKSQIKKLMQIYQKEPWRKCIYSIFPNSPLVNPTYIGAGNNVEKHNEKLAKYVDGIESLKNKGTCLGCGRREGRFKLKKTDLPLTGSGKYKSSFPSADEGLPFCGACSVAMQFSPLGFMQSAGKFLLPQSNSITLLESWINFCLNNLNSQISSGNYTGCNKASSNIPENAIYLILSSILERMGGKDSQVKSINVKIFHFTNYNQGPDMNIYDVPSQTFDFISEVHNSRYKFGWRQILSQGFTNSVNASNIDEEIKQKRNDVISRLFHNKPIWQYFFSTTEKKAYADWALLSYYMNKVINMDKKIIKTIKSLGDKICVTAKETNNEKRINQLQQTSTYEGFRGVLLKIQKDRLDHNLEENLISIDDLNKIIYQDEYTNWKLVRDLILFRCYENLHEWLAKNTPKTNEEEN